MTKTTFYITPSGELVILESRTGKEIWRGMPKGVPVSKAIVLPDTSDIMILLAYSHHSRRLFSNLIRMRPDGAYQCSTPSSWKLRASVAKPPCGGSSSSPRRGTSQMEPATSVAGYVALISLRGRTAL